MSTLGRNCLVTYYEGHASVLDRHFANLPACEREPFRFGEVVWIAVWWRNGETASAAGAEECVAK